jgi:beta-glucosidase
LFVARGWLSRTGAHLIAPFAALWIAGVAAGACSSSPAPIDFTVDSGGPSADASSSGGSSGGSGGGGVDGMAMGGDSTSPPPHGDGGSSSSSSSGGMPLPMCNPDTAAIDSEVSKLLGQMTQAEKVGQMVMADYPFLTCTTTSSSGSSCSSTPAKATSLFLGAILASGNDTAKPGANTPQDWLDVTNQYRSAAAATRLAIPLIFGIDAVHGNAKVPGTTVFPQSLALGATRDSALVQQVAAATASEVLAMGLTMAFAPDADVGQDERWGRTYETFGEDPTLVTPMVAASVAGFQNGCWSGSGTLLGSVKHAIGAGGTSWGTGTQGSNAGLSQSIDRGDCQLTEDQIRAVHLPPFKAAIDAGAMTILISYSSISGAPMTSNSHWLTDIIKTELGFRGFLLTDYDATATLPPMGNTAGQAAAAINAGVDMVMLSRGADTFITALTSAISSGMIQQSRIDDAVTRILRAKYVAGLFNQTAPTSAGLSTVGSSAHRMIARKAVQESLVLLQNNNKRLPLSKSAHIVVAGAGGNDLGIQSGGWTLSWQGGKGGSGIAGTTILQALQNAASSSSLVTYSADGSGAKGADVGVVVLSENPYAEYCGDTTDPNFTNTSAMPPMYSPCGPMGSPLIYDGSAATTVSNMKAAGIPLVLLLVTGRPVRIESYLSTFDAVVQAWLPGSAGEGVADVLYGDANFTGMLPKSWPKDATTLPISSLMSGANPLFAYGFGLHY